ncbi:MAG: molybdopterin-dependent oxidoreductase [Streptosporangiales bacterium]|nr:molybdopterin-dependent oxidoreductase [Streptosporangiales bacterium]
MTTAQRAQLPKSLADNPRLSCWLTVQPDGTIVVRVGKVELGQGIATALAQIAADELDVAVDRILMLPTSTAVSPDEGITAGSLSVQFSGSALRQACAEVRALFTAAAAAELGVAADAVAVRDGTFSAVGGAVSASDATGAGSTSDAAGAVSYGDLAARVDLDRDAEGAALPRATRELRVVGTDVPRLDLPDKVTGRPCFIHDLVLDGQLHGRVVRPPSPAAILADVDPRAAEQLDGVLAVVRDGSFLGVVATTEDTAERAADAVREAANWKEEESLPDEDDLASYLRSGPTDTTVLDEAEPDEATGVAQRHTASYSRPFLAHASMAPSCALARWDGDQLTVWTHSQGVHRFPTAVAMALGIDSTSVTVHHVVGAGCYGHNPADDVAFDAVLLARAVPGRPVRVRWSRRDELTWAPFGSAMSIDVEGALDADGNLASWTYDVWSQGHTSRPGYSPDSPGLLAATHLERPSPLAPADDPAPSRGGGGGRNAVPLYAIPRRQVRVHRKLDMALRSSALRSLGAFANVFATESFVDELAALAGRDPLEFRLAHLTDPRGRAVLEEAAARAGWADRQPADSVGYGIGLARYKNAGAYCAVVAEVEAVHEVRVRRLTVAVDVGQVVNPDGVRNQLSGGAIQAASWTLKERVRFDRLRVISDDWESYPILGFREAPRVDVHIVSRPDEPSLGAGEAAQGPTAAAIGNAVTTALDVRVRDLPITTERIVAALE